MFVIDPAQLYSQEPQLPTDYAIDFQLAEAGRSRIMRGTSEISGTAANQVGDEVFKRLTSGLSLPYQWKMTLVNNGVVNASSTAGGKIYVDGGMVSLLGNNKGLWAAVLSHETAHTARRHQVSLYLYQQYVQRMIAYYRARARAGDKSANWSLVGFAAASRIAMKKFERDQEHDADQQGMLLMARAGYHPDYVFALHHLLLMKTGEQSKFAAFFSDHPRWETRDQRSDKVYADALAEYSRLWPDPAASPGGSPPVVAFLSQPQATANKNSETADVTFPFYCRNSESPIDIVIAFRKDNHPVKASDPQFTDKSGNFAFHDKVACLEKNENSPVVLQVPAEAVSGHDRNLKAVAYVECNDEPIAGSKEFDIHFPAVKGVAANKRTNEQNQTARVQQNQGHTTISQASSSAVVQPKSIQLASLTERLPSDAAKTGAATPTNKEEGGTLSVAASSDGAELFVDSTGRGKLPTTVKLSPGKHTLQVVLNGYQDWVEEVSIKTGETTKLTANLQSKPPPPVDPGPPAAAYKVNIAVSAPVTNATPSDTSVRSNSQSPVPNQGLPIKALADTHSTSAPHASASAIGLTGIEGSYGVILIDVSPGPAQDAGLKIGDTIIAVDENRIKTSQMLEAALAFHGAGSKVKLNYIRNGIAGETTVDLPKGSR